MVVVTGEKKGKRRRTRGGRALSLSLSLERPRSKAQHEQTESSRLGSSLAASLSGPFRPRFQTSTPRLAETGGGETERGGNRGATKRRKNRARWRAKMECPEETTKTEIRFRLRRLKSQPSLSLVLGIPVATCEGARMWAAMEREARSREARKN